MCLLTIKAPASKGLFGKITIFFPFFRSFFIGYGKPYHSKHIDFTQFDRLTLDIPDPITFCADGEALKLPQKITVSSHKLPYTIYVCEQ